MVRKCSNKGAHPKRQNQKPTRDTPRCATLESCRNVGGGGDYRCEFLKLEVIMNHREGWEWSCLHEDGP